MVRRQDWNVAFTEVVPAKRTSRNRPAGHSVLQPVNVTRDVYRRMLVDKVIPAIREKWPSAPTKLKIQQDNAKPHVLPNDAEVVAACNKDGWAMSIVCQPPNSPELNVLDLGFFRAIQSLQSNHHSRTVEDIVAATMDAWNVVDPSTLSRNFMTLQACFQEVIRSDRSNNYKIPHLKKSMLMAQGKLPECLPCDRSVWADGCSKLSCVDFDNLMSTLQVEVNAK
ncbi:hypothetical protein H310_15136 [Aphanomyces invadans]|uniref:Tc1-like transposase DDE domain-containing protein n=1 Tax=Aphanomyces invadans TaxID=157072 RepID=A0A024T7X9_9STRA|nr:hypothetical protein H310_15136 [Aphanomyces invadans]ETV90033.1 hypothetical protein H310_15136 [Aphanomyces invadans]|eukprot:XP_008881338.1 hypothetical protein H310_15136 [Aphanomyces invadans]